MKALRVMSLIVLVSLSGAVTRVYGQQERRDEERGKPEKKQGRSETKRDGQSPQHGQPEQRQAQEQRAQPQQEQRAQPQPPAAQQTPQRTQRQAQDWQRQNGWRQQGGWQGQASTWQQARSSHWQSDHRTWAQRGGYGGYYIPQDRFSLYFGTGHLFRIRSQPIILGGYPRFQYGGSWFMMVDPWPESWSDSWYSNDDVYIDYDDGYYLYDRRYPGTAIAITVVL